MLAHYREPGVEFELWDNAELRRRMPIYDTGSFWPPKRPEDPHFWDPPGDQLQGAIFTPGLCERSSARTHNLQRAAGLTVPSSASALRWARSAETVAASAA